MNYVDEKIYFRVFRFKIRFIFWMYSSKFLLDENSNICRVSFSERELYVFLLYLVILFL